MTRSLRTQLAASLLAATLGLTVGLTPTPTFAQNEPPPAEGEGDSSGRPLDGYLATTPGGIYAVLGTAAESGSNVTFVMASQVIRVVLMLFAAPFVARLFMRFTPKSAATNSVTRELVPVAA